MGPGTTREGSSPVAGFVTIRVRTGDGLDEPKMTCLSFVLPGCLGETTRFFGRILWTGHTSFFWPLLQVTAKCWSCCCRPFSRISCTVQVLSSLANLLACKIPGPKLWLATWSPQAVFDVWGVSNYADFWVIDKNVPWYFSIDTGQLACHVCVAGSKASSYALYIFDTHGPWITPTFNSGAGRTWGVNENSRQGHRQIPWLLMERELG